MLNRFYRMVSAVKITRVVSCGHVAVELTVDHNADIVAELVRLAMRAISSRRMCRVRTDRCSLANRRRGRALLGSNPKPQEPNGADDGLCRRIALV